MTPQKRNELTKKILMGGAGALAMSYGWNHYKDFGGYYMSKKDEEKRQMPLGSIRIGNETYGTTLVGKVFVHFPLLAVMQIAATARWVYEDKKEKGDTKAPIKAIGAGVGATFSDLPAMENIGRTADKIASGQVAKVGEDAGKTFIPNAINYYLPQEEKPVKDEVQKKIDAKISRMNHKLQP